MKKLIALLLAAILTAGLAGPALAASDGDREQAAWTLYTFGLFKGVADDERGFPDFALEQTPTRAQGVTMLVRLLGKESAALNRTWSTPFTDVPGWARPYVGYAYENGLTNGVSETSFAPDAPIRTTEYLTLVLRALGYSSQEDFAWDRAWELSDRIRLTDGSYREDKVGFDRGDVAWISLRALDAGVKESGLPLKETLDLPGGGAYCLWEESWLSCLEGQMVFAFAPAGGTPAVYESFTVESAWANGLPCQIRQCSTRNEAARCLSRYPEQTQKLAGDGTFAVVCLTYNESAALYAAEKTVEEGGRTYPVIRFQLDITGTLPDGTQVKEKAEMEYYILGHWGEKFDRF